MEFNSSDRRARNETALITAMAVSTGPPSVMQRDPDAEARRRRGPQHREHPQRAAARRDARGVRIASETGSKRAALVGDR